MAPKRARAATPQSTGRQRKAPKAEPTGRRPKAPSAEPASPGPAEAAAAVDAAAGASAAGDLAKDIAEVVAALPQVSSLTPACCEMVGAMAPHCLSTPRSQRHEFQNSFAESLTQLFSGEEDARRAAVEATEAEVLALREEAAGAGGRLEAARSGSAAAEGRKVEAAKELAATQRAVEAARASLAAVREAQAAQVAAAADLRGRLAALELALADCWEPLVTGDFPGGGWRTRDKLLAQVAQLLKGLGTPESLVQAISTAFKAKAQARGKFAEKAIEHGKEAFDRELSSIKEKLAAAETEPARAELAEAEAALKAAEEREAEALRGALATEDAWAEAESAVVELKDAQRAFGPRAHALAQKLDAAKAALAEIAVAVARATALERREEEDAPEAGEAAEA